MTETEVQISGGAVILAWLLVVIVGGLLAGCMNRRRATRLSADPCANGHDWSPWKVIVLSSVRVGPNGGHYDQRWNMQERRCRRETCLRTERVDL